MRVLLATALALLVAPLAPRAGDGPPLSPPVPWHDPGPIARMFLQPPLEPPELAAVEGEAARWDAQLLYSSSIFSSARAENAAVIHVETAQLTPLVRWRAAERVELQAALPVLVDWGGFLDRPILTVESWFRAVNSVRRAMPAGAAEYRLATAGGTFSRQGGGVGVGDAWVAAKLLVVEGGGFVPAVALRPIVKLPTGTVPFGSGEADVGVGVHLGWRSRRLALRVQLDAVAPTGSLGAAGGVPTRAYGDLHVAATWQVSERVAVHAQGSRHLSPVSAAWIDDAARPASYVLAGVSVRLAAAARLDVGLVENVFCPVSQGADATVLLGFGAGPW